MIMQVIDPTNGNILIAEGMIITNATQKSDLINYFGADHVDIRDMKNTWMHYSITCMIGSKHFAFTLFYDSETLKAVDFITDYIPGKNIWDNWSEKNEYERLEKFKIWLSEQLGSQRDFSWGSIGASFDNKGGFSGITMRYN